jgi:hypothetical protein
MNKSHFSKIWTDPVWSKVISVAIIALFSTFYITIKSYYQVKSLSQVFTELLNVKFELKYILIVIILAFIVYVIYSHFSFKYSDSSRASDIKLFDLIREKYLDQNYTISFLRSKDFGGSFMDEDIKGLRDFINQCKNSDFKFLNPKLEKIKIQLLKEVDILVFYIGSKTFIEKPGIHQIPKEWSHTKKQEYNDAVKGMNSAADKICILYDNLIIKGRKELDI